MNRRQFLSQTHNNGYNWHNDNYANSDEKESTGYWIPFCQRKRILFPYLIMGTPTLKKLLRTIKNENALTTTLAIELTTTDVMWVKFELMQVKLRATVITFLFRLVPFITTIMTESISIGWILVKLIMVWFQFYRFTQWQYWRILNSVLTLTTLPHYCGTLIENKYFINLINNTSLFWHQWQFRHRRMGSTMTRSFLC